MSTYNEQLHDVLECVKSHQKLVLPIRFESSIKVIPGLFPVFYETETKPALRAMGGEISIAHPLAGDLVAGNLGEPYVIYPRLKSSDDHKGEMVEKIGENTYTLYQRWIPGFEGDSRGFIHLPFEKK